MPSSNAPVALYKYPRKPSSTVQSSIATRTQRSAMAKMLVLLISATLAGVLAEPPVPNSYLPPSQNGARTPDSQYGAPIIENRALSTQYGAPEATSRFGGASARFGAAPSNQYGAPSASGRSFGGIPSNQYGAPASSVRNGGVSGALIRFSASDSSRSFSGALSTRYGAPSASARIGGASARFVGAPSTRYGVPSASGRSFGGAFSSQYSASAASSRSFGNALSSQYGAPSASTTSFDDTLSSQYGAPAASSRAFGGSPSSQYGAPFASGRSGALSTQYGVPAANSIYAADGGYAASARNLAREADLAEPANYEFGYEVEDAESGASFSQEEARQDEQAQGSYRVLLPDGRLQIVEYEADLEGYKPRIRYEDIGTGGYARGGPQQRGGLEGPY